MTDLRLPVPNWQQIHRLWLWDSIPWAPLESPSWDPPDKLPSAKNNIFFFLLVDFFGTFFFGFGVFLH